MAEGEPQPRGAGRLVFGGGSVREDAGPAPDVVVDDAEMAAAMPGRAGGKQRGKQAGRPLMAGHGGEGGGGGGRPKKKRRKEGRGEG